MENTVESIYHWSEYKQALIYKKAEFIYTTKHLSLTLYIYIYI